MRWLHLCLIVLVLPLAACATNRASVEPLGITGPYAIDAGDALNVLVYGEETLSKTYLVDSVGQIALPLAGPVSVRGKSTTLAAAAIAAKLSSYLRRPDVTVEIAAYRPFYIQGGVTNSGQFPFVPGMTARAAISTAGGFPNGSGPGRVTLYRTVDGQVVKQSVDLNFPIAPGDTIVVGSSLAP